MSGPRRTTRLAAAALAALLGAPALAQPISTQPLAPGEVLLELNATGRITTRADVAVIDVTVFGSGDDENAARAAAEANRRRVIALARAAGVAADDVESEALTAMTNTPLPEMPPPEFLTEDVGAPSEIAPAAPAPAPAPAPEPGASSSGSVRIRMRNVAGVDALEDALEDSGAALSASTSYYLDDSTAARQHARSQAVAAARADAEAYAAAIGMRVARIVRVSERPGFDFFALMFTEGRALRDGRQRPGNGGPEIETSMIVGVDFALGPR